MKRYLLYTVLAVGLVSAVSCRWDNDKQAFESTVPQGYRTFYEEINDSLTAHPQWVRLKAKQQMTTVTDSMEWYYYATIVMKTHFFNSNIDSVLHYYKQGEQFCNRQPMSALREDLAAEYHNLAGNIYARRGVYDTAAYFFEKAYEQCLNGIRKEMTPDILMNLADARRSEGKYDLGAFWYRRALLICDSLHLTGKKTPVHYGLGNIYMTLRDFERCDYYFDLAQQGYSEMLPFEQFIYLNNRGNSYYYRQEYLEAMHYFRRSREVVTKHSELVFEQNLCYLNMSDVFLKIGELDSSEYYLNRCRPFFEEINSVQALYYVDTQALGLALKQNNFALAQAILNQSVAPAQIEPDIFLIRNQYLQHYYQESGDYKKAFQHQQIALQLIDSVRSERVKMRVADAALRYAQDSTLMAKNVLIEQQKNQVLQLQHTRLFWVVLFLVALSMLLFIYMYSKKKRALLLARNRRTVSTLRMENIRNRLSPHFIFNVLNQQMAHRKESEQKELLSLIKLMRRNLELAEQPSVTLAEELDFVQTYIDLERCSLGPLFDFQLEIAQHVDQAQVLLPPMLLQIPVENAVKHALREKEGARKLRIAIDSCRQGVTITITDNGGGYRVNTPGNGTGTGMKVIVQTIQLLNMQNKEAIDMAVQDVVWAEGEKGLEVKFVLPHKYDYKI